MTSEFLPKEFRGKYSMYLTKPDDELVKKYEKYILNPYFAPLMADNLEGWSMKRTNDKIIN